VPQKCPVCSRDVKANPRYPGYVCSPCSKRATAPDGRHVEFFQSGPLGLLHARYTETGEPYVSEECDIDGTPCLARVAHFGGIVIQAGNVG
jgi:hypothetical protein